jgi:hypothetical protein
VGIDVEDVRPVVGALEIAARWFAEIDAAALATVPPHRFEREFLQVWTRTESSLKALGVGLSGVAESRVRPAAGGTLSPRDWRTADLALGPEHVGAPTVESGAGVRIATWRATPARCLRARHPFTFELADSTASAT